MPETPPSRPKHQVHRSVSETSPPTLKLVRPHHHQLANHHHVPHLHHRENPRRKEESGSLSAHPSLQPWTSSSGDERGDKKRTREGHGHWQGHKQRHSSEGIEARSQVPTPSGSRNGSRRSSVGGMDTDEAIVGATPFIAKRAVKVGEVKAEREKAVLRATELQDTMTNLNSLSNSTTRRLDNTYYSVLEKLSVLQNTITSFKELASTAQSLDVEFQEEAHAVTQDLTRQRNTFLNFESQEKRIKLLQERVHTGRETIKALGRRVEAVKARVEGWEKAEEEWQEKTRKRLKILWGLMSAAALVLMILVWHKYTPDKTQRPGVIKGLNVSGLAGKIPDLKSITNESWKLKSETNNFLERLKDQEEPLEEDLRLRIFDEL